MTGRFAGRTAIVTGAAGGIGAAIAHALCARGAFVYFADRAPVPDGLPANAMAIHLQVDEQDSVDRAAQQCGEVDILINAAGAFSSAPLLDTSRDDWRTLFEVNVFGLVAMTQAVAPGMIARGFGRIVNLASIGGRRADEKTPIYSASKAAVISITQSTALTFAKTGVTANAIAPGPVRTALWDELDSTFSRQYLGTGPGAFTALAERAIPIGRIAEPDDIVGAALFLASEDSAFVLGQTINVDGGVILG